jgi:hypothetical protein
VSERGSTLQQVVRLSPSPPGYAPMRLRGHGTHNAVQPNENVPPDVARKNLRKAPRREARSSNGWTRQHPPELEYLNQDRGIRLKEMMRAQRDSRLHGIIVARRSARQTGLRKRLRIVNVRPNNLQGTDL